MNVPDDHTFTPTLPFPRGIDPRTEVEGDVHVTWVGVVDDIKIDEINRMVMERVGKIIFFIMR